MNLKNDNMSKGILVMILSVMATQFTFGQTKSNIGDARFSLGLGVDILDQYTPPLDGLQTFKSPIDIGQRFWFWGNINSSVAVEGGVGFTLAQTRKTGDPDFARMNRHLFSVEGGLVYKFNNGYILKESFPVAPYLFAKVRGSYMDNMPFGATDWGVGIPLGGGINWRMGNNIALTTQVAYTIGVTDDFDNNLTWTLGLMFDLGKEKETEIPFVEPVVLDEDKDGIPDAEDDCPKVAGLAVNKGCPDTDGDGLIDSNDDCPTVAGLVDLKGCPDRDSDGIKDADDQCPDVAGLRKYNGCPIPDTDGDGVNDEEDKCKTVPGLVALQGCPDTDGDGIIDSEDKCPTEAGTKANKGCPAVKEEVIKQLEFAAKSIQFESGSAVIKTASFKELDKIVTILKEWKNYNAKVSGHTDSQGSDESNLLLSQKRAQAVADYFISKGIAAERVESFGFGETQPIADNNTAAGRQENRRVGIDLFVK
jgi:OOP family OmpA-OmpF porin